MNIEELIQSKRFVKGGVTFGTPAEYINPFIDIAEAKFPDITIRTSGKVENAEDTGESNISYSRGLVEMQGLEVNGIRQKFGFLYALDLQKPLFKIYAGTEVSACTNLTIFRAEELFTGFILDGLSKGIIFAKQIISNYERIFQEYMELQLSLEANIVKTKDVLGPLLQYSIKNPYLGTTPIVYAAKELQDSSSRYFAKDGECSMWNVYNSVTQSISSKSDIADKASKTLILSQFKEFNIN